MINLTDYIKAKKIKNEKEKAQKRKEYKENILELEVIVFEAIMHDQIYFYLEVTSQSNLVRITDKLYFDKQLTNYWQYRIKINLLSLCLLKREVKKVKKWKIK